jgi:hypothetical protein
MTELGCAVTATTHNVALTPMMAASMSRRVTISSLLLDIAKSIVSTLPSFY